MSKEPAFYVEREDFADGRIAYHVWQRDMPPYRNKKGVLVSPNQERLIVSFNDGGDFKRDAKEMANRVCIALLITEDMVSIPEAPSS